MMSTNWMWTIRWCLVGERIFTDKVDHIATENVEGAKRATSYLLQTGCKRVAVVGVHPGEKVGSAALRYQGYLEALEEAGVEFDERLVVESGMWHRSDGVRVMNALLDSGVVPDGVVALNDMLASGVMHAIQMHNLRIPEDISVIGFDNSDDSQYLSPALTSIAPGLEAVARLSVKLLKDRIDGVPPSKDLKPEQEGVPQGFVVVGGASVHQAAHEFLGGVIFLPSFSSSFGRKEVIGASALASGFLRIAGAEVFVFPFWRLSVAGYCDSILPRSRMRETRGAFLRFVTTL